MTLEEEKMKIKGIVSAVKNRETNYSIKVGDDWFGGYGKAPCKKGDEVEVEYEENGKWKNISDVKILSSSPYFEEPTISVTGKDYRINVDAGNILQREVDILNGIEGMNVITATKILTEGNLGKYLVEEYKRIQNRLKEYEVDNVELPEKLSE